MQALCFALFACAFNLLIGYVGLLSFGHALYFAAGVYGTDILVTRAGLPLWQAALLTLVGGTTLAALLGAAFAWEGGSFGSTAAAAAIRAIDPQGELMMVGRESVRPYHRPPLSKGFLRKAQPRALLRCFQHFQAWPGQA